MANWNYLILAVYYWIQDLFLIFVPKRMRYKDISEDIVLITGAGSGLGRLLSLKLSRLASHVVLWDVNENAVNETAKLVTKAGGRCSCYVVDVSDANLVYATAAKVRNEVGPVSILINNAGIVNGKLLLQLNEDEIVRSFKVNTFSHYWTCKAFLPEMMSKNSGHIVSITSTASYSGLARLSDYCGSKAAAAMFFESMVLETKDAGFDQINFTLIAPHLMSTGMFSGAKSLIFSILNPKDVADRIVDAILTNEHFVVMPAIMRFLISLRSVTAVKVQYMLYCFVGYDSMMSNFAANTANTKQ